MTLDDLQSAIRGAHDVKPAPLTDADVVPKRSPLPTFVPGTQTNPILLPKQTITATPENDLTQDDIERVLSLAMTGGDEELPKDGRWHVPSVKDALAKRGDGFDLEKLLKLDEERKDILKRIETLVSIIARGD